MNVKLSNRAQKQLDRLDAAAASHISTEIRGLRKEPPEGDIVKLKGGKDDYRLRVGDYRIFFYKSSNKIVVENILTRGQAYKNRR